MTHTDARDIKDVCYGYLMEWSNGYERFIQLTNFGTVLKEASLMLGHSVRACVHLCVHLRVCVRV